MGAGASRRSPAANNKQGKDRNCENRQPPNTQRVAELPKCAPLKNATRKSPKEALGLATAGPVMTAIWGNRKLPKAQRVVELPPLHPPKIDIDKSLEMSRMHNDKTIKLVFLGPSHAGKSTMMKQLRILFSHPPSQDELQMYQVVIRSNVIVATCKLCRHLHHLELESSLDAESNAGSVAAGGMSLREAYNQLMTHVVNVHETPSDADDTLLKNGTAGVENGDVGKDWVDHNPCKKQNKDAQLFLQHAKAIQILWQSQTMKTVWTQRAGANVIDAHGEFFQDLARIASPVYTPTAQDILLARSRTRKIIMDRYCMDGATMEVYSVGEQNSEVRKWIDCLDQVDVVCFVAALSEYDQHSARCSNRMVETLNLFQSVVNHPALKDVRILLLLNKKDLFAEKILHSDIAAQPPFCDFAGPAKDYEQGVLYFVQKFQDCGVNGDFDSFYIHVTCATDTNKIEDLFDFQNHYFAASPKERFRHS